MDLFDTSCHVSPTLQLLRLRRLTVTQVVLTRCWFIERGLSEPQAPTEAQMIKSFLGEVAACSMNVRSRVQSLLVESTEAFFRFCLLQAPTEAQVIKALLKEISEDNLDDSSRVQSLRELKELVRPIDNANGASSISHASTCLANVDVCCT